MSDHRFFDGGLLATCVSADAATRFTATDDFGFCSSFPAVDATFADVVSPPDFLVAMGTPLVGDGVVGLPSSPPRERPPIHKVVEAMWPIARGRHLISRLITAAAARDVMDLFSRNEMTARRRVAQRAELVRWLEQEHRRLP